MKMTIGATMAMALMLSLPLATFAQEVPPAPADAADASADAVDTAAQEADNTSNAAIDTADDASDAAGDAVENSADNTAEQAENRADDAERASDEAEDRVSDEANADRDDNADRNNDDRNNQADQNRANRNNQPGQPYTTGYRGARQPQYYNNQPGQTFRQSQQQAYYNDGSQRAVGQQRVGRQQYGQQQGGQQAYYNDGYQQQPGQQQAYQSNGQQGHVGQQTAHHEGANHSWGEEHPSVGQQEWMCIDGRRQLVTVVSVSKVSREEGSQNYPERAVQYEGNGQYDGNQQSMPAAPQESQNDRERNDANRDRNDSQNDRRTPPPMPEPSNNAVQQGAVGTQPAAANQSTGPADGSFEGDADRNGGRIEATEIRD